MFEALAVLVVVHKAVVIVAVVAAVAAWPTRRRTMLVEHSCHPEAVVLSHLLPVVLVWFFDVFEYRRMRTGVPPSVCKDQGLKQTKFSVISIIKRRSHASSRADSAGSRSS